MWASAPALGAADGAGGVLRSPISRAGIGGFTPASADPKLAAVMARSGIDATGFRFTPSASERGAPRAVTVAVRAQTVRPAPVTVAAPASAVSVAPIAYNLGAAVGWKKFALSGDLARIAAEPAATTAERVDLGLSYGTRKPSTGSRLKAAARPAVGPVARSVADTSAYSIDVAGSYALTRSLAVTAGVQMKDERDRLPLPSDARRDSQSVYVGTAFRF